MTDNERAFYQWRAAELRAWRERNPGWEARQQVAALERAYALPSQPRPTWWYRLLFQAGRLYERMKGVWK